MKQIQVFLAGDSTMCEYEEDRKPRMGWGQALPDYFTDQVSVVNEAASGRSSKSFIQEGRLKVIDEQIQANDFLFIQFGHNDQKPDEERHTEPFTSYQENLKTYVEVARKHGAYPILLSSVQRRNFSDKGLLEDTHGEYPIAMKELAAECGVPYIDITEKSTKLFAQLGEERTKELFMWVEPGQYPGYPEGEQDNTHFSEKGAHYIAKLVLEGIQELELPLQKYIKEEWRR